MAKPKKKALGKGLGALIGLEAEPRVGALAPEALSDGAVLLELDPRKIQANPHQPRQVFDEENLQELAESIRQDGVHEPVIVRKMNGEYQLVSGERRVRASILAELEKIPAVCREVSDRDMLRLGLIENIQRENLNPIEMAHAYQELTETFKWTQEELAKQVGKKRVTVTNMLRLLNLPINVQEEVTAGRLTMGHARALLALDSPAKQAQGCRKIIQEGLSVRQAEKLASPPKSKTNGNTDANRDPNIISIEDELRRTLGTRVRVKTGANHKGKIEIDYFSLDDLERILSVLRS